MSPTESGVCECDREASIMRRPWRTGSFCFFGGEKKNSGLIDMGRLVALVQVVIRSTTLVCRQGCLVKFDVYRSVHRNIFL
jgi:hypothetical protein